MTTTYEEAIKKIAEDNQGYLSNYFEDAVVRFEKVDGANVWFLKFQGEKEFKVERSHRLVFEAIQEGDFITKDDYDAF